MVDFETDAQVRKAGWESFAKIMAYCTVAVAGILALMGIFLA